MLQHADRSDRGRADAEQGDPLTEVDTGDRGEISGDEKGGQIQRHEQAERGHDLPETALANLGAGGKRR